MDPQPQSQGLTRLSPDINSGPKLNSYLQPQQVPSQSHSQRQPSSSPYQTSQKGRRPLSYQPQPTYLEAGRRSNNASPQRRPSPLPGRFNEEWDASQRGSSIVDGPMQRTNSMLSQGDSIMPSRAGTLKKKSSLKRTGSLKRSGSRRSSRAGSVRSLALQPAGDIDEMQSAFYSPVPTSGNPTEILANRFQGMFSVPSFGSSY